MFHSAQLYAFFFRNRGYYERMKSTPEMTRFNDALRSVMTVTKPELMALMHDPKALEAVRQRKGPKPLAHASSGRD
jgi:hypothetical protein